MTLLPSDPRMAAVPVRDVDEPLVALDPGSGPGRALVRRELATLLESARTALPSGICRRVVEGYRPPLRQQAIIERYSAEIRAVRPGIGEQSGGRCNFAADRISREARVNRDLLARVLCRQGLVNYPTEWWHYSHGDRYWAVATGAAAVLYGPVFV